MDRMESRFSDIGKGPFEAIAILGVTASGKSEIAANLAEYPGGAIISCDSRQVYRGMNLGTAKPSPFFLQKIPHYLIDVVNPGEGFNNVDYVRMVENVLLLLRKKKTRPLFCGGTGLYFEALIRGYFSESCCNATLAKELEEKWDSGGELDLYSQLG
ncbi:tRNA (adenosine(37)-N6)-dimethylallyltransferase, partial [Candidatus Riflebacteria bacterium]